MTQPLTLELPEQVYETLMKAAIRQGQRPEAVAVQWLATASESQYEAWTNAWVELVVPLLKPTASVYVCSEWRSSGVIQRVLERHFIIKNRITWEREKGRWAARNWKNNSEDIWFCVRSEDYDFDVLNKWRKWR